MGVVTVVGCCYNDGEVVAEKGCGQVRAVEGDAMEKDSSGFGRSGARGYSRMTEVEGACGADSAMGRVGCSPGLGSA